MTPTVYPVPCGFSFCLAGKKGNYSQLSMMPGTVILVFDGSLHLWLVSVDKKKGGDSMESNLMMRTDHKFLKGQVMVGSHSPGL